VVALEALDDGPENPGTTVFLALADRAIVALRLPVERPRALLTADELPSLDAEATWHQSLLTHREVARLSDAQPTSLLAVPADTASSGQDELFIGTNSGLRLLRRREEGWSGAAVERVHHRQGLPTSGDVTALTALPDGRVAAAYWNEVESLVLLHEPSSLRTWPVRLKDPRDKVYALAAITGQEGSGFLAVRQSSSLALSTLPIFHTAQPPRWPWFIGGGLALGLLGVAALVMLRRRNPLIERLKIDPEAIRDLDLAVLGEADRNLRNLRRPILAAAGVEPRRWELAVELGDAWALLHAPEPSAAHRLAVAELIAQTLDARFKGRQTLELESGQPFDAFTLELPRLPINLPTAETGLFIFTELDAAALLGPQPQPRAVEDLLGHLLRQLNQSMGTPFLLATSLPPEVNLPALVHARFPALVLRAPRLRSMALHPQPRKALSQLILTDCWLDAISPYKSSGPVEDPAMFVGRERERRELVAARSVSAIICGGRRVGKTSLIRQLVRDLQQERPEMAVFEVSLLGIRSYTDFIDRLERRLGITISLQDAPRASAEVPDEDPELSPALARIRRRRARRSNPSLSPETATAAIHEGLETWCVQRDTPPLLILDEIDGIAARDAEAGYPLLSILHQLKSENLCSFVLVGFAELYRQTFDYDSPLYNFARVMQLGPLDPAAARRLILEPIARLGVELPDEAIADRIVEATAGFPNLVQFIGDMLLRSLSQRGELRVDDATLDPILDFAHPASQPLSAYVAESFDQNVTRLEELLVYTLLLHGPRPSTLGDIATNLERLGLETDLATRRALVRRLKLVGVLKELPGEHFDLALPLLVQLLQAKDLELAIQALTAELEAQQP
jgi:MYXO-CTERM domain-containing protein